MLHNWKTKKWWVWLGWYWIWQKRVDRIHWKTSKNLQSFFFANNWEFSSVLLWRRIFRSRILDNKLLGWGIHSDEVRQSNNYTVQYSENNKRWRSQQKWRISTRHFRILPYIRVKNVNIEINVSNFQSNWSRLIQLLKEITERYKLLSFLHSTNLSYSNI